MCRGCEYQRCVRASQSIHNSHRTLQASVYLRPKTHEQNGLLDSTRHLTALDKRCEVLPDCRRVAVVDGMSMGIPRSPIAVIGMANVSAATNAVVGWSAVDATAAPRIHVPK